MIGNGRRRSSPQRTEEGIGLVEVMAATVILMITVISLSNLLVDSLSVALLAKQREVAASLASDLLENAKAIGQSGLTAAPAGSTPCTPFGNAVVPVRNAATFQQCFTILVDKYTYSITPVVTTGSPDAVKVTVAWSPGAHAYVTYGLVGH